MSILEEIVKKAIKGEIASEEIKNLLEIHGLSPEDYNSALINIFSSEFHGNLSGIPFYESNDFFVNVQEDLSAVREMLKSYYKIDNCPSFLNHNGLLEKKDYELALKIYSKIFKIDLPPNLSEILKTIFDFQAKKVLDGTDPNFEQVLRETRGDKC